ncbi:carbon storage regulator [Undibacterium sp. Rencai35W]|uniref:carbon storage regulator n=1 Tax=Undibacterium sp. Rencai35W TaxID=3413046 RepID=UPI003BF130A0
MSKEKGSLTLDIRPGERVMIGGELVEVELVHKSGQHARIKVTAPTNVKIELVKKSAPMMAE